MEMAVFLLFISLFISLSCFLYNVFNLKESSKEGISRRLNYIKQQSFDVMPEDELGGSFKDRIIKPVLEGVGKAVLRLAPKEMIANMERKIIMAGRPYSWGVKNWLGIQAFMVLGLPVLVLLLYIQLRMNVSDLFIITLASVIIGLLFPNMLLNSKIRKRQSEITKSLPDIMDLLTVSVEAGLTFDSALSKVIEKMPGPLAREFETVLQEIKVGKSKKEALYQMSDRIGVQDLRSFVSAVVQADQLGVSLGRVLRLQAEQIRRNRKQRISEKAMKAPIKMLIPMVVFIFPVIFIVLLGPVVINLIDMFAK